MSETKDVRIVGLKCPNCGGSLRVPEGADRTQCEHCGGMVMVIDGRNGHTMPDTPAEGAPVSEETKRRVFKIALWGTVISFAFPVFITAVIFIILAVIFLVFGLVFVGSGG